MTGLPLKCLKGCVRLKNRHYFVTLTITFCFPTEWVQMAPALFSKFIPNILPPAVESELEEYAAQDQKLQQELIQEGFSR